MEGKAGISGKSCQSAMKAGEENKIERRQDRKISLQ